LSRKVVVVAGPNGAGKTTFAQEYLKFYDYEYLSADNIADEIAPGELEKVRVQAGRLFFQKLSSLIEQEKDFAAESTLSGVGFRRTVRRLRQSGYRITIIFIFLGTPETCVARIRERVLKGGHDVPEPDIVRRFYRSKENFWRIYRIESDSWYLFHNSGEHFQQVAFGERESYTVSDQRLFDLFMQGVGT